MPALHVGDKFFERVGLVDRIRIDGIGIENSLADVAECAIDRDGQ